jgi:hypothetical protein
MMNPGGEVDELPGRRADSFHANGGDTIRSAS